VIKGGWRIALVSGLVLVVRSAGRRAAMRSTFDHEGARVTLRGRQTSAAEGGSIAFGSWPRGPELPLCSVRLARVLLVYGNGRARPRRPPGRR
jgi:hypothetical protein